MPGFDRRPTRIISNRTASQGGSPRKANTNIAWPQAFSNNALQRLLRSRAIQAKLTVNKPGDKDEQEADRLADAVMRMPDGPPPEVAPGVQTQVNAMRGGGQALPEPVRAFFEPRFGRDLGQVRVHTDAAAAESARALNARAFNVGRDIVFGAGQYAPEMRDGRWLLAHELAHFVQHREAHSRLRLKPLTEEEKTEDLKSPRLANDPRLQAAFDNNPLMTKGERGDAVKLLQRALMDHGFEMPLSTKDTPDGEPDGIFGNETWKAVHDFQVRHHLKHQDGIVGRETLRELDTSFSATITLKQIRFISDHNSLKDHRTDWEDSGNRFPDPEWTTSSPFGIAAPITHTKNSPIRLEAVCDISAPAAGGSPFVLRGRGSQGFLNFTSVGDLASGTDVVIPMNSVENTPDAIKAFRKQKIDWSATFLGSTRPLGSSVGHDVFITFGIPSGGVTYKRMAKAVEFASKANTLDEHTVVEHIMAQTKFRLGNHLSQPWALADAMGLPVDCITIVRFVDGIIRMLGMEGTSQKVLVWAHPDKPHLALESPPLKGHLEDPVVTPSAAEIRKDPRLKGSQAALLDCSKPPGPNRFEATLRFNSSKKTVYYAGGVGAKPDAQAVLFDTFRSLSWVRFVGRRQFFIIKRVFLYHNC